MKNSFDSNLLLRMLNEGHTQEEIAEAFAASLNEAAKRYKKESQKEKEKLAAAEAVANFYKTYYPEISNVVTAKDVIAGMESAKSLMTGEFGKLNFDIFNSLFGGK